VILSRQPRVLRRMTDQCGVERGRGGQARRKGVGGSSSSGGGGGGGLGGVGVWGGGGGVWGCGVVRRVRHGIDHSFGRCYK